MTKKSREPLTHSQTTNYGADVRTTAVHLRAAPQDLSPELCEQPPHWLLSVQQLPSSTHSELQEVFSEASGGAPCSHKPFSIILPKKFTAFLILEVVPYDLLKIAQSHFLFGKSFILSYSLSAQTTSHLLLHVFTFAHAFLVLKAVSYPSPSTIICSNCLNCVRHDLNATHYENHLHVFFLKTWIPQGPRFLFPYFWDKAQGSIFYFSK